MKPVTDSESSSETSETYHDDPAAVDHESVYAQNITCDAAFKFFKVGKASPSLEFMTIVHLKKDILLSELCSLLVKQHMVGVDLFKKFPATTFIFMSIEKTINMLPIHHSSGKKSATF